MSFLPDYFYKHTIACLKNSLRINFLKLTLEPSLPLADFIACGSQVGFQF